mgnify:CR=1 FL=1
MRICPKCKLTNGGSKSAYCSYDGMRLIQVACPGCGYDAIVPRERFCVRCGREVEGLHEAAIRAAKEEVNPLATNTATNRP